MTAGPLALWLLGALPQVSAFDDGAVVGRVCDDRDGDGQCSADEPGVAGVRVMLETGLVALTDAQGRFHFAAVGARAPDTGGGGRLLPGRHRLKVDPRALASGTTATLGGVTFELPMGGLVQVDVALRSSAASRGGLVADLAPPRLEVKGETVRFLLRLHAPLDSEVRVRGGAAALQGEAREAWVELRQGHNSVIVTAHREGRVEVVRVPVDVVHRESSWLVIPRATESVGTVELPYEDSGAVVVKLYPGTTLLIDGAAVPLDAEGAGTSRVSAREVSLSLPDDGWSDRFERPQVRGVFAVGLLDVEATLAPTSGHFQLFGRGAGAARAAVAGFELSAEVDLRDADLEALRAGGIATALGARRPELFERQLDVSRTPLAWDDDSATVATNAPESRLRLQVSREGIGRAGFGSYRAFFNEGEVGRFHRAVQAAYVEVATAKDAGFQVRAKGFAAPGGDVTTGLARLPAHERFEATGGSLYFLAHGSVATGSELVRVELRDAVTGFPVSEQHLLRGRDYSLDAVSGRIVLARPLSFVAQEALLKTDALSAAITPILVVDYEYVELSAPERPVLGGEVGGRMGPVSLQGGYARDGNYELLRGVARAALGPVSLSAEVARSSGLLAGLATSRDGGLSFFTPQTARSSASGLGVSLRARGQGLGGRGFFDVAWRLRQAGYEDTGGVGALSQLSARVEQPLGHFVAVGLADIRDGVDPRLPFDARPYHARLLGGGFGWEGEELGVRLEVRDAQLSTDLLGEGVTDGGRLSVGLNGRYRVAPWLTLRAGYRQRVWQRGGGEGAWDDSFASGGADVHVGDGPEIGVRAGWGPRLGPQVWGVTSYTHGEETWYGVHSVDVDAPALGERRLVTGARREVGPGTAVFVEDVAAHDVDALRLSRAVGLTQQLPGAMTISARYEHGLQTLTEARPVLGRDAGGLTWAWESRRVQLFARGEARVDSSSNPLTQFFGAAGGQVELLPSLRAVGRLQVAHTTRDGVLDSRLIDGSLSLAWRFGVGTVVARYSYLQELLPRVRDAGPERRTQLVSLLPALQLGSRVTVAGGAHLALAPEGVVVSASLRPGVRIVAGLELAVEVARRSSAIDGGSLTALRGEVGYRFDDRLRVAAGYTLFGFSGTGLEAGAAGSNNRAYLRAEVGY